MLFNLQKCREYVLTVVNQKSATGFLTPADLDLYINEAYMSRVMDLIEADQGYFSVIKLISLIAGTEAYALPSLWSGEPDFIKAYSIERVLSDRYVPLDFMRRYVESSLITPQAVGDAYLPNCVFRGGSIIFEPTPADTISAAIRLIYAAKPPHLRTATAQAGGAASITLDAAADPRTGYYVGARIMIYSGTGSGQIKPITAYVGSTKVATVDSSWTTPPDSTSIFTTLFHDEFPEIAHELVCLDAGIYGFLKERGGAEQISDFHVQRRAKLEKQFRDLFSSKTDQQRFVAQFHPELI